MFEAFQHQRPYVKKMIIAIIILVVAGTALIFLLPEPLTKQRWAVYYGSAPLRSLSDPKGWDILVLDNDAHPDMKLIANPHTLKLAYVSIGEVAAYRKDFQDFKNANLLMALKKGQQQVYVLDIRKPEYYPVIKKNIEKAQAQGFNGIMLDTLDTSLALEHDDQVAEVLPNETKPLTGMKEAAITLIKRIHKDFPKMKIMVNRAFEIIPDVSHAINMVIAESTITGPLSGGGYGYYTGDALATYDAIRASLKKTHVPVYALDYWSMTDGEGIENLYAIQRAYGFCPYVSDPSLQELYREP